MFKYYNKFYEMESRSPNDLSSQTMPLICPSVPSLALPSDVFSLSDFYIGLGLAIGSTVFIGSSFVIKKKGLLHLSQGGNLRAGKGGHGYLKDWLWWAGFLTLGLGELLNFVAYAFAPATLVTPLGCLSVLVSAVLASRFLNERLSLLGKLSCFICIVGSTVVVIHSPKEGYLANLQELWEKMQDTTFMVYFLLVVVIITILVFYIEPKYGQSNILVNVSICSLLGSLTVLASKGLGIAIRETVVGTDNGMLNWLTWLCLLIVVVCIVLQTHYLNKALDTFNTALLSPLYYVAFTTSVILGSAILYKEWNNMNVKDVLGTLCGFSSVITSIFLLHAFKDVNIYIQNRFQNSYQSANIEESSSSKRLLSKENSIIIHDGYESESEIKNHNIYG